MKKENRQRYTFTFEPGTYEKIRVAAELDRRSLSSYVEVAVLWYIDNHKPSMPTSEAEVFAKMNEKLQKEREEKKK